MKQLIFILIILFLIPFAYSLEYYIDEKITIQDNGDALIQGSTNVDFLEDIHPENENIDAVTSELTEKRGRYWRFYYNSNQNLTASFIEISLPKGAIINHIKSPLTVNIATNDDIITATFFGENEPAEITVQYSIGPTPSLSNFPWSIIIIATILAAAVLFTLKINKNKSKIKTQDLETIKTTLNETQIKIIDTLLEKKGQASQTVVMYMTGLPKSSLSRNIELLAKKEIIQKFYNGTSNFLKIHPRFKK